MLRIIGVGICDGHITERAKKAISEAKVVYGSARAIRLAERFINGEKRIMNKFTNEIYEEIEREAEKESVAVLSTGDPMVAGLGKFFKKAEVEPGISSIQLALAKLKIDLCDVIVYNAHGKRFETDKKGMLILADKSFDLSTFGHTKVTILEDLCMDERIRKGFADEIRLESNNCIIYLGD
ncbi:MAG: precorrin-6y C5,15-methyltransferase (decarboxylating) subunit CbiE [Archaeoglobaceae archaeon]